MPTGSPHSVLRLFAAATLAGALSTTLAGVPAATATSHNPGASRAIITAANTGTDATAAPYGSWRQQARFGPDDPWGVHVEVARAGYAFGTFRAEAAGCEFCDDNPSRAYQRRDNSNTWSKYTRSKLHGPVHADIGTHSVGYAAWLTGSGHLKVARRTGGHKFGAATRVRASYPAGANLIAVHALPSHALIALSYVKPAERRLAFQFLHRQPDNNWAPLPAPGSGDTDNVLPQVTELPDGSLLVVWQELDPPAPAGLTGRIKAATYTAGTWSTPVTLSTSRGFPSTLTPTGGGALATWVDATTSRVHSAFFDGATWGSGSVLDHPGADTVGVQNGTAIVAHDGTVTAAWLRERQPGRRSVIGATWRPGDGWTGPLRNLTGTGRAKARVADFDLTAPPPIGRRVTLAWSTVAAKQPVFVTHQRPGTTTWTRRERLDVGPGPTDSRLQREVSLGASKNGRVTLLTNSVDGIRALRFRP